MAKTPTIAKADPKDSYQNIPGIRTEEARTRPRVERATARFFSRIYARVDKADLEAALADNDQRRVLLLFELAAPEVSKGLENVLGDALNRAGKITAKEINRQAEGDGDEFIEHQSE